MMGFAIWSIQRYDPDIRPVFHHKVCKDHKGNFHNDIKFFVFLVVYRSRRETDQCWFFSNSPCRPLSLLTI